MRKTLCGLAGVAALAVVQLITASASLAREPYAWCAVYSGGRDGIGATTCGFDTFEQCQETVHGMGGFCQENPSYPGPERRPAPRKRHRG